MKQTLTTYDIADALCTDENANWSRAGACALAEYLDENLPEDAEFCRVEIRCDWSEYVSLVDWADDYYGTDRDGHDWKWNLCITGDMDEDEIDDLIREHIQDHGTLIEFNDGVIVSSF